MLDITITRSDLIKTDEALRQELLELTAPSYEDPSAVVEREWKTSNSIYLARDGGGNIVCFFMVAWETLEVEGSGCIPTLHLGLSAAGEEAKMTGLTAALYTRCLRDAIPWEKEHGQRLIAWGTTATPIVYLATRIFSAEIEPRLDGSYSARGAEVANALRRKLGAPISRTDHPFVLKNIATNTRYSPQETERIERVSKAKNFSLFRDLGIDESAGDRLLFLAPTPDNPGYGARPRGQCSPDASPRGRTIPKSSEEIGS
jgi:hypothetical protein